METNRDLSGSTKILSVGGLLLLSGGMSSFPVTICLMSQDLTYHMDTKVYGGMCVYLFTYPLAYLSTSVGMRTYVCSIRVFAVLQNAFPL